MTAIHKREVTLTIPTDASVTAPASARYDEEEVRLTPARSSRVTQLTGVEVTTQIGSPALTIRELDVDDDTAETGEPGYETETYPGRQLFYVEQPDEKVYWLVETESRDLAVDEDGAAVSAQYRAPVVNTQEVVCELTGMPGDSLTVGLIYETAGDQRF
jgi:hypothetical protein